MPVVTVVITISILFYFAVINTTPGFLFILISCSKWRSQPMNSKMSWTRWCLNVRIFEYLFLGYFFFCIPSSRNDLLFTDKDINTEGFSRENCRSMIALMDVSFVSRLHVCFEGAVKLKYWVTLYTSLILSINFDFCVNYCLLIVSKVVKFRNWVGLRDVEYSQAELWVNMCFISTNKQQIC